MTCRFLAAGVHHRAEQKSLIARSMNTECLPLVREKTMAFASGSTSRHDVFNIRLVLSPPPPPPPPSPFPVRAPFLLRSVDAGALSSWVVSSASPQRTTTSPTGRFESSRGGKAAAKVRSPQARTYWPSLRTYWHTGTTSATATDVGRQTTHANSNVREKTPTSEFRA